MKKSLFLCAMFNYKTCLIMYFQFRVNYVTALGTEKFHCSVFIYQSYSDCKSDCENFCDSFRSAGCNIISSEIASLTFIARSSSSVPVDIPVHVSKHHSLKDDNSQLSFDFV